MNRLLNLYYYCNQGGVCSVIKQRMPHLLRSGWQVDCLFTTDNGGAAELRAAGIAEVYFVEQQGLGEKLKELCSRHQYRLFSIFDMPEAFGLIRTIEKRYKIVYEMHSPIPDVMKKVPPDVFAGSDAVIVPSQWSRNEIVKLVSNIDPGRIVVVPNIVDDTIFFMGDALPLPHPAVVWMGKFAAYKNPLEASAVLSSVVADRPKLHAYLLTGGQSNPRALAGVLEQFNAVGALGRIHWIHNLPHAAMGNFLRRAAASRAVFLHTSVHESFCLAVHEAARCGLPVVAALAGPLEEVIESGRNGYLYSTGDQETAKRHLREFLDDDKAYDAAVRAHSERLRRFDPQSAAQTYLSLLERATGMVANIEVEPQRPAMSSRRQPDRRRYKVAAVLDEFSRDCFSPELDLVELTPANYKDVMSAGDLDFVLIESAWVGLDGAWIRKVAYEAGRKDIYALVDEARRRKLPVVFWNKEDPMHYDLFIGLAKRCDYVFTTDAEVIPRYVQDVGHERVYSLPFAAQPVIHNPIGRRERDDWDLVFAGTWYERFPDRNRFLDSVFDAAICHRFHIYDRHFFSRGEEMRFPDRYAPYIYPAIPYRTLMQVVKGYKLVLNVNTVVTSSTMCARRPFEISATATPVVSNPSVALDHMLPDLVFQAGDAAAMRALLDHLLTDQIGRYSAGHRAWRYVMERHTYAHRVREMVERIGLESGPGTATKPPVTLVTYHGIDVNKQAYPAIVERRHFRIGVDDPVEIAKGAQGDFVIFLDAAQPSSEHVVGDMVLAGGYADAEVIGKPMPVGAVPDFDRAWRSVTSGKLSAFMVAREVPDGIRLVIDDAGLDVGKTAPDTAVFACDPFWL